MRRYKVIPEHSVLKVSVQTKKVFEIACCLRLKTEFVLMDDSVYTAAVPVAVEVR
jgi:hypothetical protein